MITAGANIRNLDINTVYIFWRLGVYGTMQTFQGANMNLEQQIFGRALKY